MNPCGYNSTWKKIKHLFGGNIKDCVSKPRFDEFNIIRAVIFIVSLTAYDSCLDDDELMILILGFIGKGIFIPNELILIIAKYCDSLPINGLTKQLEMFSDICNDAMFQDIPLILILNKIELFTEKLETKPLNLYFQGCEYTGNYHLESALYIQRLFEKCNKTEERQIYSYITTATDQCNVMIVFQGIEDLMKGYWILKGIKA